MISSLLALVLALVPSLPFAPDSPEKTEQVPQVSPLAVSVATAEAPPAPRPAGECGGPGLGLRSAKIMTMAREGPQWIDHGVLLIRDGRIEAVGRASETAIPVGYELIDVGERWLMPGIVELHSHIGSPTPFAPNDINDMVFMLNPGLRVSPGAVPDNKLLRRAVAGGVTTALYIPGSGTNVGGHGLLMKIGHDTYEDFELRNPGSFKMAQAGNPERWGYGVARTFMNWSLRLIFRQGVAYAKRWEAYERGEGPKPEKNIRFEIFRDLRNNHTQVSTHTQWGQVVMMTVRMVAVEFGIRAYIDHGSFGGYLYGDYAQEHGVAAILGPRQVATFSPYGYYDGLDTDGRINGMAAEYQRRGHKAIGFNTDAVDGAGYMTPPQEEISLQAAMAVRYGLDNANLESLRGLTIIPAETANLADRIGSLEPGKDADVLVLSGDVADPRSWVQRVYTDGELVYDHERDGRRW